MATVMNDRDVLLQASQRATDPRANKYLAMAVDTPFFHVGTDGKPSPDHVTFNVTPVNIGGGTLQFTAGSTKLTQDGNSCTLAFADMTTDSVTVTATITDLGQTYTATQVITKVQDGSVGKDGKQGNQYAVAYLYKWFTAQPDLPQGTSTLSWDVGANTSYIGTDGWFTQAQPNPATPGVLLWVAQKAVSAPAGTQTTDIIYTAGAALSAISQNGATGMPGIKNTHALAYQWATGPAPTATGTATWTWSLADYDNLPSIGWTKTKGSAPALGYTLFEASVGIVDSTGAASSSLDWGTAIISPISYMPTNGTGTTGASAMIAYTLIDGFGLNASPATALVSGKSMPQVGTWGETRTWQSSPPTPAANQAVFQSNGIYDGTNTTWSVPYLSNLRVGSLSSLTENTGSLNVTGTISSANGNFVVDANGNATMKSIRIEDAGGNIILQSGGRLATSAAAAGTLNSDIKLGGRNFVLDSQHVPDWGNDTAFGDSALMSDEPTPYYRITAAANVSTYTGQYLFPKIPVGTQCVVSCDVRIGAAGAVGFYNGLGMQNVPANTWTRIFCVFTYDGVSRQLGHTYSGSVLDYRNYKVEIGNIPTDWTPAPEDIQSAIDSAQAAANAANAAITNISSDNVLSKGEKSQVIQDFNVMDGEFDELVAKAGTLGVDSIAYYNSKVALNAYVNTIPTWRDTSQDTPIVGSDFRANFANYYTAKQALLNAMAAKAATMATGVSLASNGQLIGAGGGQVTLPGMGQNSFRVVALGGSATSIPVGAGLYVNGTLAVGVMRSFSVTIIRRSDGVIVNNNTFDVYGSGEVTAGRGATEMAAFLNSYGLDYIVVVVSNDEPYTNRMIAGLPEAMYRCGASRAVFGSPAFQYRAAYILVGICGCGEGNGAEAYQGSFPNDPNAWAEMGFSLINGVLSGVSMSYTPKSLTDYGYTGDLNATAGATLGTNVYGQITTDNINALIAAGTIGSTYIKDLAANKITAGTLTSGVVYAGAIGANQISAGTLSAGVIYSGSVAATQVSAGTLSAGVVYSGTVAASQISASSLSVISPTIGTLRTTSSGARVEITDNLITVFDSNGPRVKMGKLL